MPEAFNKIIVKTESHKASSYDGPSNASVFSKALFTHFSVNKLQRISKLEDWNSHLALKANVNTVIKSKYSRNPNSNKVVARSLVLIAGRLYRPGVDIDVF